MAGAVSVARVTMDGAAGSGDSSAAVLAVILVQAVTFAGVNPCVNPGGDAGISMDRIMASAIWAGDAVARRFAAGLTAAAFDASCAKEVSGGASPGLRIR